MTMPIKGFMTKNPLCISTVATVGEARSLMRESRCRHLPVAGPEGRAGHGGGCCFHPTRSSQVRASAARGASFAVREFAYARPRGRFPAKENVSCPRTMPSLLGSIGLLERRDVELDHLQHRVCRSLRPRRILVLHHLLHYRGDDLPAKAESVDEPPARLRLSPALEERVPVAVELRLVLAE